MAIDCASAFDSSSNPALAGTAVKLDLQNPAQIHSSSKKCSGEAVPRPVKKAKRGPPTSSDHTGMDCDLIQKFPTSNLFDLLAKKKNVEAPHAEKFIPQTILSSKPRPPLKPKKPPPIYVHGKFEKYSNLYSFIREEYGRSTQMKYFGDKMKLNFDTIERFNKFKA